MKNTKENTMKTTTIKKPTEVFLGDGTQNTETVIEVYHLVSKGDKIEGYIREDNDSLFAVFGGKPQLTLEQVVNDPINIDFLYPHEDEIWAGYHSSMQEALDLFKKPLQEYKQPLANEDKVIIQDFFGLVRKLEKEDYSLPFMIAGFIWEMSGIVVLEDNKLMVSPNLKNRIQPIELDKYTVSTTQKLLKVYNEDLFRLPNFIKG